MKYKYLIALSYLFSTFLSCRSRFFYSGGISRTQAVGVALNLMNKELSPPYVLDTTDVDVRDEEAFWIVKTKSVVSTDEVIITRYGGISVTIKKRNGRIKNIYRWR